MATPCQDCRKLQDEVTYLKAVIALNSIKTNKAGSQSAPTNLSAVEVIQRQELLKKQLLLIRADVQYLNREVQAVLEWIAKVISVFLSCCGRLGDSTAFVIIDSATKVCANVSRIVGQLKKSETKSYGQAHLVKKKCSSEKDSNSRFVALDCEMVEGTSVEHMLARVSIVDYEGRPVYDVFVRPRQKVVDYRTSITGLTKEILSRKGEAFKLVRAKVLEILKDKIVIGHAVHHDFEALEIDQPGDEFIRDTCLYPGLRPPSRKQTPSLRLLAEYWLDKQVQTGSHSSVEDARTCMILFKRFQSDWEKALVNRK